MYNKTFTENCVIQSITFEQNRFAQKYVECNNAAEAYRYAFSCDDMAPGAIYNAALALKKRTLVAARIIDLQLMVAKELLVSENSILTEYARIATSDVRKLVTNKGILIALQELDIDTARAISSVKVVTKNSSDGRVSYVHEYKFWPKMVALEALAKRLGFFKEQEDEKETFNVEVTVRPRVE